MNKLDIDAVRNFYNNTPAIWAPNDQWHQWSYKQIEKYLSQITFTPQEHILNAGSGGNSYGLICDMIHVDIAEKKLKGIPNAIVSSIESMPFHTSEFDHIVCVGSVINYCDASAAISEFSRVIKQGGKLILEFENSGGYEYCGTSTYRNSANLVTVKFQGEDHNQWLYSLPYIKSLLLANSFAVDDIFAYHICSSLALYLSGDETKAVKYAQFDAVARMLPMMVVHANNFILNCRKL